MSQQNKLLGQHWLYDEVALDAVAEAAGVKAGDTVLEVGPGLGTLTARLINQGANVIAVEKDEALAKQLQSTEHLEIVEADILKFNFNDLPSGYRVAANIPYYLTSKLIRLLIESTNPPKQMGLLIQKEVAERIVAEPGNMSVLSFAVQYYAKAELGPIVPAVLFDPPPKVDSQVISIKLRDEPQFEADVKKLFKLVKAGFGEKRKKLVNSLAGGLNMDKQQVKHLIEKAGNSQDVRAQELSMDDWRELYKVFVVELR